MCTNTNLNNATLYKAVGSCSLLAERRGKQETGAEVSCSSSVITHGIHDKHTILFSCIYTNSLERPWKSVKVHLVLIRMSVYSMNVCMSAKQICMRIRACFFFFFLAEMKESDIIQHFVTRSLRPPSLVCCRGFKQLGRRGCVVIVLKVSLWFIGVESYYSFLLNAFTRWPPGWWRVRGQRSERVCKGVAQVWGVKD